jgi:hypothetical protein
LKKILIIIPYFGKFPEWVDLYFETLRQNSTIDFFFFTDCAIEKYESPNIKYKKISFQEYVKSVNIKKNINFSPNNAYKICDLRPLFGIVHKEIITGYDFYGWTDMDILFGNIRSFYTDDILEKYFVFSTHEIRISGHFALFRNSRQNIIKFKKIYDWKKHIENPEFVGIDEHGLTNAYTMTFFDKFNEKFKTNIDNVITRFIKKLKKRKLYLKEQYTTPFTSIPWLDGSVNSKQPDVWYYKNGQITNNRDGERKFMYLHFMNFKSSTWRHDGSKAPWEGKEKICFADVSDMNTGIVINNEGIKGMYNESGKV